MYTIIRSPSMVLRTPVRSVNLPAEKLQKIIAEMKQTLILQKDPEGVGLAANQVSLPYRLFLARFNLPASRQGIKKNSPIHVFINPEVISHSKDSQPDPKDKKPTLEGCLSLPRYYGVVRRWQWIELKYQNEKLETKTEIFKDFAATVIQHEMDHLSGKIFVERILEQQGKLYKLSLRPSATKITGKDKKGKESWDEVKI